MNDTPVIGINYTEAVGDSTQIVLQSHIPVDGDLNGILDTLSAAASRQRGKRAMPELRKRLANAEKMLDRAMKDMARIDVEHETAAPDRRGNKLNPAQKADREKANISLDRWREDIANLRETIAEHETMIGT